MGIVVFPVLVALSLETFIMKKLFAVLLQTHKFAAPSYFLKSGLLSDLKKIVIQKVGLILKTLSDKLMDLQQGCKQFFSFIIQSH
jgi:hypothetical protein